MQGILRDTLYAFIPIFVAIDIFAVIPIFASLTEGMSRKKRLDIERDSVVTALAVGLVFIALGEGIFRVLSITANDFKIAGGLILLIFAILDLMGYSKMREQTGKLGVVPLGVPLIVGPAVLATVLVLVDHYGIVPTIISFIVNLVIVWISFRASSRILSLFGKGGITAISKIMALLLASIAVMLIRVGLENIVGKG
ncbi:MAG: MarC family protein [Nitrospirae bacterium]|nr:MarC family protein [Nitrospirota bacterium]